MSVEDIDSKIDTHEQVPQPKGVEDFNRYKEQLSGALIDMEIAGNSFIDSSERFTRYVHNQAPYPSTIGENLSETDHFKTIQAAEAVGTEDFRALALIKSDIDQMDGGEVPLCKERTKKSFESMQLVFQKTTSDAEELWGTIMREHRKLSNEYRNDIHAQEEEDFLRNAGSLLRDVYESSETMKQILEKHAEIFM